jgi:hypothetical protein
MSQRIQQFDPSMAAPVSQSYLNHDSIRKGIPEMNSNVPPQANMDDGSLFTNLQGGQFQAQRNMTQGLQNARANQTTLRPQAAAAAMGVGKKQMTQQATAEKKANDFAANKLQDVIYYTSGGGALKELSTKGPDFYRSVEISSQMFGGPQPGTLNHVNQQMS